MSPTTNPDPRPWVKVPAKDLIPGMRLWDPDGSHATFIRRERGWIGSQHLGVETKRVVFIGSCGREVPLAVETWTCWVRVVREDVPLSLLQSLEGSPHEGPVHHEEVQSLLPGGDPAGGTDL